MFCCNCISISKLKLLGNWGAGLHRKWVVHFAQICVCMCPLESHSLCRESESKWFIVSKAAIWEVLPKLLLSLPLMFLINKAPIFVGWVESYNLTRHWTSSYLFWSHFLITRPRRCAQKWMLKLGIGDGGNIKRVYDITRCNMGEKSILPQNVARGRVDKKMENLFLTLCL